MYGFIARKGAQKLERGVNLNLNFSVRVRFDLPKHSLWEGVTQQLFLSDSLV